MQAVAVLEVARAVWEAVLERCCGLDVHKKTVTACLLIGALHGAIESTGIYWRLVFHILEDAVTVLLVNAYHMKQIPGRKTDLKDAQWIARLLRWGLLKPSLIPPKPIRELRGLCRYHKKLTEQASAASMGGLAEETRGGLPLPHSISIRLILYLEETT